MPKRGVLAWPLAGSYAQIVGDVGQSRLVDLAMRITVESSIPRFSGHDREPGGS